MSDVKSGGAYAEIFLKYRALTEGLSNAQRAVFNFGMSVQSIMGKASGQMHNAFEAVFSTAMKASNYLDRTSESFAGLQDIMLSIKGVLGATNDEYKRMYDLADAISKRRRIMAEDAGKGMLGLARGGFSVKEIEQSIEPVLNLALATGTTLDRAVESAIDNMRAFNFEAKDMGMIADTLTAGANMSSQSIEQLTDALRYSASSAALAGTSFQDLVTMIATLANFGVKGSMAGTAIRQIYTSLSNERIGKRLKEEFGVVTEIGGQLRQPLAVLKDLEKALSTVGSAKRLAVFQEIFGQRGKLGGMNLRPREFSRLSGMMGSSKGYAASTAAIMESGTGAAMQKIKNAFASIVRIVGEAQNNIWISWQRMVAGVTETIGGFLKKNQGVIESVAKIIGILPIAAGAALAFAAAVKVVGVTIGLAIGTLGLIPAAITAVVGGISFLISPIGILSVAIGGLSAGILTFFGNARGVFKWLSSQLSELAPLAQQAFDAIGIAFQSRDLELILKTAWTGIRLVFNGVLKSIQEGFILFKAWIGTVWSEIWSPLGEVLNYVLADMQLSIQTWIKWISNTFVYAQALWNEMRTILTKGFFAIPGMKKIAGVSDADIKEWEKSQSRATAGILKKIEANDAEYAEKKKTILAGLGQEEEQQKNAAIARESAKNEALLNLAADYAAKKKAIEEELAANVAESKAKIQAQEKPLTIEDLMKDIASSIESPKTGMMADIERYIQEMMSGAESASSLVADFGGSQGRFAGWGLRGLETFSGGSKPASEETAKSQLDTMKNIEKLMEEGNMNFS